jgi:predicted nucleic acid-binding protein
MIVVSDTSCISNLLTIGQAHLLAELFGEVILPPAVENELRRFHTVLPGFLKQVVPRDLEMLSRLKLEIDSGEAEAI